MTEKLTTFDPAEDLTSYAAIATFMAAGYASDAGHIAHALGAPEDAGFSHSGRVRPA
jgi:DNA-binding phage protein